MATINPYLIFNGNAEEAFNFYKSVFGGEFTSLQRYKDIPEADKIPAGDQEKIIHVSLPIGQGNVLMASDGPYKNQGDNFSISVDAESEKEATRIFNQLSAGGKVNMPLEKTFWNAYFGMLTDKFGINWMVSYDYNQQK